LSRFTLRLAITLQAAISAGDGLAMIALANRVYQSSHASWAVAAVFLALTVPITTLAPIAGLLLDRLPTRPVLVAAAAVEAAVAIGLAVASGLPATLALALCFGVCAAILQPGLGAVVPRLAGDTAITRANSYLQAATWAGFSAGPLLAGLLISTAGSAAAFGADATLYALGAAGLWVLRLAPRRSVPGGLDDSGARPRLSAELRAGFGFLRSDPEAAMLVLTVGAVIACANMAVVAEVVFAEHVLRAGPGGYSLLVAAWTACMVAGTLAGSRLPVRWLVPAARTVLIVAGCGGMLAGTAGSVGMALRQRTRHDPAPAGDG
jgi:MFS family permease